jgi:hypothetical protein
MSQNEPFLASSSSAPYSPSLPNGALRAGLRAKIGYAPPLPDLPLDPLATTKPAMPTSHPNAFATLTLKAAKLHREAADRLDVDSKSLAKRIEELQESLDSLEEARGEALRQSAALRDKAQALSLEGLAHAREASAEPSQSHPLAINFHEADLASTRRHGAKERSTWSPGDRFDLVAQPDNPMDPNAIMVMQHGKQVGFLSKDCAAEIKDMERNEGWRLSGPAFLKDRKGGQWNEGVLHARMENPILGWSGYNPGKSLGQNLSAMETEILGQTAHAPQAKRKASLSL